MTTIYESRDHILLYAEYSSPTWHRHTAAHVLVSMEKSIHVMTDTEDFHCFGVVIPSGVSHCVETDGSSVLVFLYDCSSTIARQIQSVKPISGLAHVEIVEHYREMKRSGIAGYHNFERKCLDLIGLAPVSSIKLDDRICDAIAYIRQHCCDKVSCKEVADAVFLSQGRFSHLFREQVGMTFAAYLIYQRIICTYTNVFRGESITEAALAAGFASSAHFADVNRRLFGISLSAIIRDLEYVKVV